jgi:hypothetical protein
VIPSDGLLADIPNPISIISDGFGSVGGWAFDKVAEGIASWVLGAVEFFVNGAIDFLRTSSSPDPNAAWFSGADSPYAAVRNLAGLLLVAFIFLGVLQGLLHGDASGMVRRVAGGVPAAVAGMVLTTTVVGHLLALTDAMSDAVLAHTGDQALHFLSGFGATATSATGGFAAVLLGLVAAAAGLLLWIELIVRASLVYVLVAISPLSFAAIVWPATRSALRRTVELLLAVVFSKVVICIALAIGVAALSGAGTAGTSTPAGGAGFASNAGASAGGLLVGAVLLGLAAFSPFIVLKIVPIAESALVAQGISHAPARGAQAGMSTVNSAGGLRRLAGSNGSGSSATAGSAAGANASSATAGTAGQIAGSAGAGGAAAGGGAVLGGGAAAGAGAAAAGPVVGAAAAVKAGSTLSSKVAGSAGQAGDTARRHAGSDGSEGGR